MRHILACVLAGFSVTAWAHKTSSDCERQLLGGASPIRLKVATWNLHLLKIRYQLGRMPLGSVTSHNYDSRSERLGALLKRYLQSAEAPDVLLLQEVWTENDHNTLVRMAHATGYWPVASETRDAEAHGMQILVKRSQIAGAQSSEFLPYGRRVTFEHLYGVQRGLLSARWTLPNGQKIWLATTHLTPLTEYARVRASQVDDIAEFICRAGGDVDHVLIGGDLNLATDFACRSDRDHRRHVRARWVYDYFLHKTGLGDSFRAVNSTDPGYTFNPEFPPVNHFRHSYSHKRLDYIFAAARGAAARQKIVSAGLEFTEPINDGGDVDHENGIHMSDHFLYFAVMDLYAE